MHAQRRLDVADEPAAPPLPHPSRLERGAIGGDPFEVNCLARIRPPGQERRTDLRLIGDLFVPELSAVARRLFTSGLDAAQPRLNGSLTRQHIGELTEGLLDLLFPGWFNRHAQHSISL